jgi:hypothetical protein
MYYLKLSGFIPENKKAEFEQTYRFVSTQIPKNCAGYNFSKDALNEGVYYFISYWSYKNPLQSFSHSAPFVMLSGAFKTLGKLYENITGEISEDRML